MKQLGFVLVLIGFVGCSPTSKPLPKLYPVSGKVVFKDSGKPVPGGIIRLTHTDPDLTSVAAVTDQGTFNFNSSVNTLSEAGVPEGEYAFELTPPIAQDQQMMKIKVSGASKIKVQPKENDITIQVENTKK